MNDIVLRAVKGTKNRFIVVEDYKRTIDGKEYLIKKGFETDLVSVPKIFWSIIGPWGLHGPAAIVHDYLYIYKVVPQKEADRVFLKIMEQDGVSFVKRYFLWAMVRLLGWTYYKNIIE